MVFLLDTEITEMGIELFKGCSVVAYKEKQTDKISSSYVIYLECIPCCAGGAGGFTEATGAEGACADADAGGSDCCCVITEGAVALVAELLTPLAATTPVPVVVVECVRAASFAAACTDTDHMRRTDRHSDVS